MCFGHDGERALRESLEQKGASRRTLIRGAVAGAAGAATLGGLAAAPASAAGARHDGATAGTGTDGRRGCRWTASASSSTRCGRR